MDEVNWLPLSEVMMVGEHVPEAFLGDGEGPHKVHMYVREALGGYRDGLDCRQRLPDDFGATALLAVRDPVGDVTLHEGPRYPAAHQLSCSLGSQVGEAVEGGEHFSAVGSRYEWPGVGSACVAEEVGPPKLDQLEGGAYSAGCCGVRVHSLGYGDGCVINLHGSGGDNVDLPCQRVGECVRHRVVHAADVPDVAEMSALPGCPGLHRLGKGVGQRLVVGVEGELPALQHEPKVPDPQHAGQKLPVIG